MADLSITVASQPTSLVITRALDIFAGLTGLVRNYFGRRALIAELESVSELIRKDIGVSGADMRELRKAPLFSERIALSARAGRD